MAYVIGIDGGGTSCRAAIADMAGNIRGRGRAGPANIMTDLPGARDNIVEAARLACLDAGLDESVLGRTPALLGLAGANIGNHGERIKAVLPFREAVVESDAFIALHGALGDHDGAIAILGTGSIFLARTGSTIRRVGGWGFMVGDLGSGARIGRALLQETLLAHDGVHPASDITNEVLSRFGGDPRKLVEYAHMARPGEFGTFAPIVFDYAERGDPIALALVNGALRSIEEALDAIMPSGCDRLCLLGGLSRRYEHRLSQRHRALVREPLGDAQQGAVALAMDRFQAGRAARHG